MHSQLSIPLPLPQLRPPWSLAGTAAANFHLVSHSLAWLESIFHPPARMIFLKLKCNHVIPLLLKPFIFSPLPQAEVSIPEPGPQNPPRADQGFPPQACLFLPIKFYTLVILNISQVLDGPKHFLTSGLLQTLYPLLSFLLFCLPNFFFSSCQLTCHISDCPGLDYVSLL